LEERQKPTELPDRDNCRPGFIAQLSARPRAASVYDNVRIDTGFKADLVIEDKVIVENKSVALLTPAHKQQHLTYLAFSDQRLGLPINFHVTLIKDGIARIVNGLQDDRAKSPGRKEAQKYLVSVSSGF